MHARIAKWARDDLLLFLNLSMDNSGTTTRDIPAIIMWDKDLGNGSVPALFACPPSSRQAYLNPMAPRAVSHSVL